MLLRHADSEIQEPYERITIDIPPDYIGEIQSALAGRKGRLEQMSTDADGRVRIRLPLASTYHEGQGPFEAGMLAVYYVNNKGEVTELQ